MEKAFYFFLDYIYIGLTQFSLLPRHANMHIDLVVDFINLGIAKRLWPQDALRTLYSDLHDT